MDVRRKKKSTVVAGVQAVLAGGLSLAGMVPMVLGAQTISSTPDAQVEANVLKALAAAPELSTQDIQSATVYGVVTLSGDGSNGDDADPRRKPGGTGPRA